MTLIDAALDYYWRGFSVIPVRVADKRPAVPWKDFQSRAATPDELRSWFADADPDKTGLAIVTGAVSGLAVVDLDTDDAVKLAKAQKWPLTPLVKTGKGYHCYYQFQDGLRNFQARADLPGVDLRAEGGYVVAPPSKHPSGRVYSWEPGKGIDDMPLASGPWPLLYPKTATEDREQKPLRDIWEGGDTGSRNVSLTRLVGSWVAQGLTREECLKNAEIWNSKNSPPLTWTEVVRTIDSILNTHKRNHGEDHQEVRQWPPPLNLARLAMVEPTPPKFLIPDWLPCGYATLFAGHGGVGKSAIALFLAVCLAMGLPFFGVHCERRRVLYLSCEDREGVLHWRLSRICSYLGITLADLSGWLNIVDLVGHQTILYQPSHDGAPFTDAYRQLSAMMQDNEVLMVDGISDTYDGNENARAEVKAFINGALALIPPDDGAVILIGHVSKPSANVGTKEGYSGSTGWHNSVRARWYLYPESKTGEDSRPERTGDLILELQKSNLGPTEGAMRFSWDDAAGMFVGKIDEGESRFDRNHREQQEQAAITTLIDVVSRTGYVPAATTGSRTAYHVLSAQPEFPQGMIGPAGKRRFWRHIEALRRMGTISETCMQRENRHKVQILTVNSE